MIGFGVTYDMWGPPFSGVPLQEHYATMLDQVAYVDERGWDMVSFNEHHGARDGYLPSPLIAATAAAARTERIALRPLLLLPLYDVVKLAEDLAVADLISGGRLCPVFGAGYRAEEFAMFGRSIEERRRTVDRAVQTLRSAWTGEPFEHDGRTLRITPRPVQRPGIPIVLGGNSAAAARAAARGADGFYPTDAKWWAVYRGECERLGREAAGGPPPRVGPMFLHVAEDPERDLRAMAPYMLNAINQYREWAFPNERAMGDEIPAQFAVTDEDDLRRSDHYMIVTPDECVDLICGLPDGMVIIRPMWGGYDPKLGWSSLRLLDERVVPAVRATRGTAG